MTHGTSDRIAPQSDGGGPCQLQREDISDLRAASGRPLNRGVDPCAFKCGPDYIDPLFHREVLSLPSRNLDLFFSDEPTVRGLMARAGAGHGLAVLEGCMGFYDGIAGTERASSWHLARATDTPVVLTVVPGAPPSHWLLFCRGCGHSGRPT